MTAGQREVLQMTTQLRIYTINRGQLRQFAREWEEKIRPLRRELGFQVGGGWLLEATNQFVWLLSYDGPESWQTQDEAYYSSPIRLQMDPDPARLIARVEEYFVESVL
jgi:hypothetical protein